MLNGFLELFYISESFYYKLYNDEMYFREMLGFEKISYILWKEEMLR